MYNPNSCQIAQGGVGVFEESVSPPPKPFAGRDGVDHRIVVSGSYLGVKNISLVIEFCLHGRWLKRRGSRLVIAKLGRAESGVET